MSLDYYLYIEDNLDTQKLLLGIASTMKMNNVDKDSLKDDKTHMVVSVVKIDDESIVGSIDEIFGFKPNIMISFTHGKHSVRQNEKIMMKVFSEIVPKVSGEAIMGFTQSDAPFLQKKGNKLLIDENWRDVIFPSSMVFIRNIGLSHSISKLSNF